MRKIGYTVLILTMMAMAGVLFACGGDDDDGGSNATADMDVDGGLTDCTNMEADLHQVKSYDA